MSFLKLKNYARKTSIRLLFSRVLTHENSIDNIFLCSSTNVQIKISFYAFVKLLKLYKLKGFFFDSSYYNDYGQKLQNNGFYNSFVEVKKKEKLPIKIINLIGRRLKISVKLRWRCTNKKWI